MHGVGGDKATNPPLDRSACVAAELYVSCAADGSCGTFPTVNAAPEPPPGSVAVIVMVPE